MKRVLIISPAFPPSNTADMHRVRQSAPYFREFGWEPTILALQPEQVEAPLDPLLGATIPTDLDVRRINAIDIRLTRRLGLGNMDLRALPYMGREGARLLATGSFDLVYFSTTAFLLMGLGPRWKQRFGVPYVIDLQDPWVSDYYVGDGAPAPPGGRVKYAAIQWLARRLEPRVIREAGHVIAVSPAYPEMIRERYPEIEDSRFSVLPFGAPERDFEILDRESVGQSIFDPSDGKRHWVYVGRGGGDMAHSLEAFFVAIADRLREGDPALEDTVFHFVGTDYAAGGRARKTVEPIAERLGVAHLVNESPNRIPYFETLACLRDAHAVLIFGSDDPGYTASKLYPYILAAKPMLAVFHENSSVVGVIDSTRAGTVVTFGSSTTTEELARRVYDAWLKGARQHRPDTDWEAFAPYTARAMAKCQCTIFDRANG